MHLQKQRNVFQKLHSRFIKLGLSALIVVSLSSVTVQNAQASASVLGTTDQQELDALSIQINKYNNYPLLKAQAKAAYKQAYGGSLSSEAESRLNNAINELAFSAIQKAANNDPYFPKVYWLNTPPRSSAGLNVPGGRYSYDNPDNIYRTIPIDGSSKYIIHGKRTSPGPTDVTFSLISNPNSQNTITFLSGNDLVVNADGSYSITVDSDPANGRTNHIQSTSAAVQLFIRNNLGNWNTETPDALTVERLPDGSQHTPKSQLAIAAEAWTNLQESIIDYGIGALGIKTHLNPVNTLSSPTSSSTLGTLVTQASSFGHFKLADDEALVARVTTGGAGYVVFPVTDPWMVTVDPIHHQSSLNNIQAAPNANGSYTFVVSVKDPGVANWIDPVGLHEGTIMVRWQNLPSTTPASGGPSVQTQVVKLADLSSVLPSDTSYVTSNQRNQQLADRAAGYALR
ncbi:GPI anchored serine-threonine rich family protein [Paenibacillus pini]